MNAAIEAELLLDTETLDGGESVQVRRPRTRLKALAFVDVLAGSNIRFPRKASREFCEAYDRWLVRRGFGPDMTVKTSINAGYAEFQARRSKNNS